MSGTGLSLIASAGLLKNSGLGVNRDLQTEVERFSTTNLSGSVQSIVSTASTDVIDELARLPSGLTGFRPAGIDLAVEIINVPQAIIDQGKSLFYPSPSAGTAMLVRYGIIDTAVSTFTSIYSAASGYAAQTFGFQGSIAQAQGMKFDDLGFQFKNYSDVISGGVTSQFKAEGVPAFSKELASLGTFFDTKDLAKMSSPVSILNNLLNQGLGHVADMQNTVDEWGLDLSDPYPDDAVQLQVRQIFSGVAGSNLDEIFEVTNFNPVNKENIRTLEDVLDINNLFSEEALVALGDNPSLDSLANKMTNIGGKFSNTTSIGQFFSSLDLKSFPLLASLGTLLPSGLTDGLGSILGKGTGPFGNPTVNDMVSSASGLGYIAPLTEINNTQAMLLEFDEDVYALKEYLDSTTNHNPDILHSYINNVVNKESIMDTIYKIDQLMIKCAEKLANEKGNLSAAGITPGATASNNGGLMNFGSNLNGLGVDPMNLGLGKQLNGMATPDITGEAISASLVEGKNLGRLAVFGIDPGTKMDPMAYAVSLSKMA